MPHTLQAVLATIGMGVLTAYIHAMISGYHLYPAPRCGNRLRYYGFICLPGIAVSFIAQYFLI